MTSFCIEVIKLQWETMKHAFSNISRWNLRLHSSLHSWNSVIGFTVVKMDVKGIFVYIRNIYEIMKEPWSQNQIAPW